MDTGDCTVSPCLTINYAIGQAVAGDTISIELGTYTENIVLNKMLTLLGAQAGTLRCGDAEDETIITPLNPAVRTLELQTGAAGAIINGFFFSGGAKAIESTSGPLDNLQIINNRISGFTDCAILLNHPGTDITISRNGIDGSNKLGSGGLVKLSTDTFDGFYFTFNCVSNGAAMGLGTGFLVDGNRNVKPSPNRDPLFDNNTFTGNSSGINSGSRSFQKVTFSNNIVNGNTLDGYAGGPKDSTFRNNTFSNNGRSGVALTDFGSGVTDRGAQNTSVKSNLISGNGLTNNGEGILFSATQVAGTIATNHVNFNRIVGNRAGATYNGTETIDVENNWWGCNFGPGVGGAGCSGTPNGRNGTGAANLDANPWLKLTQTATPTTLISGQTAAVTAKLTINSDNLDTAPTNCFVPEGTPVMFSTSGLGTVVPPNEETVSGMAGATYTAEKAGTDPVAATVDGQTVSTGIMVECPVITGTVNSFNEGAVCGGQPSTVRVVVSGGVAPYTVTLTNNGGTLTSLDNTINFTVSPLTTTTYMVAAGSQDANGCPITNSGSATITVSPTPTCMIAGADPVTIGSTNSYTGTSSLSGSNFSWEISGNGMLSGPTTNPSVSVIAGALGSYSLTLTVTNPGNGCFTTCTKTVTVAAPPTVAKAFNPTSIAANGTSLVTITLLNPNPNLALTGAALTDTMPAGLTTVSGTAATSCGGMATQNTTSVSLNGGTIPAGGSCTLTVQATGTAPGNYNNTIAAGDLTTSNGGSNAAGTSASLLVVAPPTISKGFNPTTINQGATSQLTLTFSNPAGNVALNNLAVSDSFPPGVTVAATPALNNPCGGTVTGATAGSNTISLSGGSLLAGVSSCQVQVNVTSNMAGAANNTTGNVSATGNGVNVTGAPAGATLTVVAPPLIAKSFNPAAIKIGEVSQLTLTFNNPAGNAALTNLAVSDPFPPGLTVAATPALNNTCGGTVTGATAGSNTISLSGGSLLAGVSSCQVQVNVTSNMAGAANNTTGNVSATGNGLNVTGTPASATLAVDAVPGTPKVLIADPLGCRGAGNVLAVTVVITNPAVIAQSVTFNAALPAGLLGLPNTGTSTVGAAPTVTATSASLAATTLAPGQSATVTYQVQVGDLVANGTALCITTTSTFNGAPGTPVMACTTLNCPPPGPGASFPASAAVSDQKPGSVLIYNLFSSDAANATTQNTRINLTNTHALLSTAVHLFFVDGASCSVADSYLCLSPNQTTSFLAADIDPGTTGYLVAVAVDFTGCPRNFNYLLGDEYVKLTTGHAANLGAEAFAALAGGLPPCDSTAVTAELKFDGLSYNALPRALAASNLPSRGDGNDTLLIVDRIGGHLGTGAATIGTLIGVLYDDAEHPFSFSLAAPTCQSRGSLTNDRPRTTPRYEQLIPPGRTGWLKIYGGTDVGIIGAQINRNSNALTNAGAFNQGHNLHKLTLTTTASVTIPVFPPTC